MPTATPKSSAISFDLFYGGKSVSEAFEEGAQKTEQTTYAVSDETPQFRGISIRDVNCKGAFQGIFLQGLPEMNLENISLENIRMEAEYGLISKDANNLKIKNLTLITRKMPVLDLKNCRNFSLDGLTVSPDASPYLTISGSKTENIRLKNSGITEAVKQLSVGKEVPVNAVHY